MKVWRFYILPEKDIDDKYKSYDLYAITNDKEKAKAFKETRNMNKFYVKCTKEDKETYSAFANEHLDNILDFRAFITKKESKSGFYIKDTVQVICTGYEYTVASDDSMVTGTFTDEQYWMVEAHDPRTFNKKIQEALKLLQYDSAYKIYNLSFGADADDYSAPEYWIDELAVFTSLFKHTF